MFDLLTGELSIVCRACMTAYVYGYSIHLPDPMIPDAFRVDFTPAGQVCSHLAAHVQTPGALLLLTPAAQAAFLLRFARPAPTPPPAPAPVNQMPPLRLPPATPVPTPYTPTTYSPPAAPEPLWVDDVDLLPDA